MHRLITNEGGLLSLEHSRWHMLSKVSDFPTGGMFWIGVGVKVSWLLWSQSFFFHGFIVDIIWVHCKIEVCDLVKGFSPWAPFRFIE